ncbi:MAG: hypothetical protein HZB43_06280 [candidate division Zixibacteria bacterium]|nr:hypothetical protein [candidate division Zixibacteria bacterium]
MIFKAGSLAIVMLALSVPAVAQWGDPLLDLNYGTRPACPFECDSVTLLVSGSVSSTSWQVPKLMSTERVGDSFCVRFDVVYNPDPALPVVVPFDLKVPLGMLPEGKYKVIYIFYLDNPLSTMPMIPTVVDTFRFYVAPPGDQNCDSTVDVLDLTNLIDVVFSGRAAPDPEDRDDLNCDGAADVMDVIGLINYSFLNSTICHPCRVGPRPLAFAWRWVRSVGGIAGVVRTPESVGYNQTNIYRMDMQFEMYHDSTLVVRTPYSVHFEQLPPFPGGFVIHYRDTDMIPQLIESVTPDTLKLMDMCIDCYEWVFVRVR